MNNHMHNQKVVNPPMGPGFGHVVDLQIVKDIVKNTATKEELKRGLHCPFFSSG
jgi:hypothetical protein